MINMIIENTAFFNNLKGRIGPRFKATVNLIGPAVRLLKLRNYRFCFCKNIMPY